jgi:hypothetical protein
MSQDFTVTLLREKFIIRDIVTRNGGADESLVAVSNRLAVPMNPDLASSTETFVVRAQNMHCCTRFTARLCNEIADNGDLENRKKPIPYQELWDGIIRGYEEKWNPNNWVSVYYKGKVIFEAGPGKRHPFLDIIEQCDAVNKDTYENSLVIAEDAFKKAGKDVTIEYSSNVALIMGYHSSQVKCGIIVRGPNKTTTFNFTARPLKSQSLKLTQALSVAAAFLEGVQLAYSVGFNNVRVRIGLIEKSSPDARKGTDAAQRVARLSEAIVQYESNVSVTYRPERPNLQNIIIESEKFAQKQLSSEVQEKIDRGEIKSGDWIVQ